MPKSARENGELLLPATREWEKAYQGKGFRRVKGNNQKAKETMTNFYQSLDTILTALGKKDWDAPLSELHKKFEQIPEFSEELLALLHSLRESHQLDPSIPLSTLAAIRLAGLTCWSYRFQAGADFLNPLTEPISHIRYAKLTQSNSAYPAADIIKRWAKEHLQ